MEQVAQKVVMGVWGRVLILLSIPLQAKCVSSAPSLEVLLNDSSVIQGDRLFKFPVKTLQAELCLDSKKFCMNG